MKRLISQLKARLSKKPAIKGSVLVSETNQVFKKYEKTFRDLARYDREERTATR